MTTLYYRGAQTRDVSGESGRVYHCEPRSFVDVDDQDVPRLLRMPKARCNCGRMFERRSPRRPP